MTKDQRQDVREWRLDLDSLEDHDLPEWSYPDAIAVVEKSAFEAVCRDLAICREALEWISGKDESRPYTTYYERTLDDGTFVPTFDEIAEQALAKLSAGKGE